MKKNDLNRQISIFDTDFFIPMVEKKIEDKRESVTMVKELAETVGVSRHYITVPKKQKEGIERLRKTHNVTRVILCCGGGLEVEVKAESTVQTYYLNKEGVAEFLMNREAKVFPNELILECNVERSELTERQLQILERVLKELNCTEHRVIHRLGDKNIVVEQGSNNVFGTTSITPEGRTYNFKGISRVECSEDDIISSSPDLSEKPEEKESENTLRALPIQENRTEVKSLEEMQRNLKVGDRVKAPHGKDENGNAVIIEGELSHCYNDGLTFSIIFEGGKKQTAVHRYRVIEKVA